MAKFKPLGRANEKSAPKGSQTKGVIPCLLAVLAGLALLSLFFYFALKSAVK